jgi:hypothetical protein
MSSSQPPVNSPGSKESGDLRLSQAEGGTLDSRSEVNDAIRKFRPRIEEDCKYLLDGEFKCNCGREQDTLHEGRKKVYQATCEKCAENLSSKTWQYRSRTFIGFGADSSVYVDPEHMELKDRYSWICCSCGAPKPLDQYFEVISKDGKGQRTDWALEMKPKCTICKKVACKKCSFFCKYNPDAAACATEGQCWPSGPSDTWRHFALGIQSFDNPLEPGQDPPAYLGKARSRSNSLSSVASNAKLGTLKAADKIGEVAKKVVDIFGGGLAQKSPNRTWGQP